MNISVISHYAVYVMTTAAVCLGELMLPVAGYGSPDPVATPVPAPDSVPQENASFIYRGNTIHRGQAIFPVGYWVEYSTVANKLAALKELGPAQFDIISYGVPKTKSDSLIDFVRQMDDYGVRLMYGLFGGNSPITDQITPLDDWVLTSEEGKPIRNSEALFAYYHSDDVVDLNPEDLVEKERVIKEVAPDRITSHSTGVATPQSALVQYAESADMPGIQLYPAGGYWPHNVHFHTQRQVEAAQPYGGAGMAIGHTHSLSEYFPGTGQTGRWPTPAETELYTYLSLAAGAKSLFFYTYGNEENEDGVTVNPGGLPAYRPEVWQKTIQLRQEIATLERMLLFGQRTTTPERTFDVYYGRWIYGDKVYVAAINSLIDGQPLPGTNTPANSTTGRTEINVPLPPGTRGPARPLFSRNNTLTFSEGSLGGTLDITEVQLYELDYPAPRVTNGDFERGVQSWKLGGNASVVAEGGSQVLKASTQPQATSARTDVTHRILPNQTYTFSADLKGSASSKVNAFVQVRDYRNQIIFTEALPATTPGFQTKSRTFTAPEEFGSVVVGVWRDEGGTGDAFVDNVRIGDRPANEPSAEDRVVIRAKGSTGQETMELLVDDRSVARWTVSPNWQNYAVQTTLGDNVKVVFTNDLITRRDGRKVDRNLRVDRITLNGRVLQAEDQAENTGSFSRGRCGGGPSEWLYCGGYIAFDTNDAASARRASDTDKRRAAVDLPVTLYPNPAKDQLRISSTLADYHVQIYDAQGKLFLKKQSLRGSTTLDVASLQPGVYMVRIKHPEGARTQKLVIE